VRFNPAANDGKKDYHPKDVEKLRIIWYNYRIVNIVRKRADGFILPETDLAKGLFPMKKFSKILALVLALIMVFSVLSACTGGNGGDDTTTEQGQTEVQNELALLNDGVPQYVIVRPDSLTTDSETVQAAITIRTELKKYITENQLVSIATDWIKKGETHDADAFEILIGETNYDETATLKAEVAANGWAIRVIGHKIVIYAHTDDCIAKAASTFASLIAKNAKQDENGLYDVVLTGESCTLSGVVERPCLDVPQPEGYTDISFYTTSLEGDEAIYGGATREMYDAYIQKLKDAGFEVFSETEMNGCPFATLFNGVNTIHTGFYANESTIRSIVETYVAEDLFAAEADNKYTAITTTNIAEIGVNYYNYTENKYQNTGACVVIRLADGRFVIFDGGHYKSEEMSNLIKYLKLQAKDYMGQNGNRITIAAWIITHPHSDHWGPLVGYYEQLLTNKIYVQNIVYNFLSDEERLKALTSADKAEYSNSGTNKTLPAVAKALKANVITCHVGNTYYIANMKMEVLYTIESYCKVPNDLNAVSPVMKMYFYDPATGELMNTFMHVGDCTGYGLRCAANTFKEYLLTDIGQIPHHGASTKGDDGGNILFFKYNQPATLLWTAGEGCYNAYASKGYVQCAINKSQNKNFQEVFMSHLYGRAVILNLPYTPGNAQIIDDYR